MTGAATRARSLMENARLIPNWWEFTYTKISLSLSLSLSLSASVRSPVLSSRNKNAAAAARGEGGTKQCMTATTAATPTRSRRRSCPASAVTPTELFSSTSVLNVANQPSGWGRLAAGQIESSTRCFNVSSATVSTLKWLSFTHNFYTCTLGPIEAPYHGH